MYYQVDTKSEVGKKLVELEAKMKDCFSKAKEFAEKYHIQKWSSGFFSAAGGMSTVHFEGIADTNGWRRLKNKPGWVPDRRTKKGKQINAEIEALPVVSISELKKIIGLKDQDTLLTSPGYRSYKDMIFISVREEWNYSPLEGMKEITVSEYKRLTAGGPNS